MAKAEVTLTCPSCGKEFTKSKNCYNRREADSWEEWMRGQEGSYVCPSCYGKQMREKERQAADDLENRRKERRGIDSWAVEKHGLPEFDTGREGNFGASVRGRMIEIANEHGTKDEFWEMLKSIPADGKLWWDTIGTSYGSYMSGTGIEDDWSLYDVEKWITRLKKAAEDKSDRENLKNELDELFPMPEIPHIRDLCGVSSTARWNGKFYGRNGCDVYMDGQKCTITPEQKKEWEEGQRKIAEWKAKREKHEREHNAKRYGSTIGAKFGGLAESTKFTMTIGQLRRLIKESNNSDVEIPSADKENMRPVEVSKEEMKRRFNDPAVKEILSKYGIHVTFYESDYRSVVLYFPLKDNTPVDPNDKYSVIRKLNGQVEEMTEKVINELDKNSDVYFRGHDWSDRDHYESANGYADIKTISEVMQKETKYEFEPFYGCWGELSSFISSGYNYIWYTKIENKIKKYGKSTDKKLEDEIEKMAEYAQEVVGDEYLAKVVTGKRARDSFDRTAIVIYGGQKREIDQLGYIILWQNKFGDCSYEVKNRFPEKLDLNDWKDDIKELALYIVS